MCRIFACHKEKRKALSYAWEGLLAILPDIQKKPQLVIAFTGAGGKTSWIYELARELRHLGKTVVITTTTHMYRPAQWGVMNGRVEDVRRQLARDGIAVVGRPAGTEKITYVGDTLWDELRVLADVTLVEADGSRRLPLKVLGEHEPVIPQGTHCICCLAGLQALGQSVGTSCFRWEETGLAPQTILTPQLWGKLWYEGCLQPLQWRYGDIPLIPIVHQADTPTLWDMGQALLQQWAMDGIVSSFGPSQRYIRG